VSGATRFAHRIVTAVFGGMLWGAVVGGLGGRIAMFVLRLTSDDRIRGLETDDDFTIGSITTSTFFLVVFTALIGAACGVAYLGGRRFVPARFRPAASAALFGALGGALILKPGEFDFTAVDPPVLTVLFFVALPALFGLALGLDLERRLAVEPTRQRPWYLLLPLVPLALVGPVALGVAMLLALGYAVFHDAPRVQRVWRSDPVLWVGRAVLGGAFALLAVDTVGAAADIL
jgi:hypothetical protein